MKKHKKIQKIQKFIYSMIVFSLAISTTGMPVAQATPAGNPGTYTLDADFDQGTLSNVNYDSPDNNQLQLNDTITPFEFIWVAASARGTIVKINTLTGAVLGEYRSAPDGRAKNPSRTTVDANGNVWSGNRDENNGDKGSVVSIGLKENGQCQDRNGNGTIETSTGLGDIKAWPNGGGADNNGGVTTAEDECIIKYVRTSGTNVRHLSVDGNNNIWVGGFTNNVFNLLDNATGTDLANFDVNCGGYGGLVDKNGVVWSSSRSGIGGLLRYDTKNTNSTADDTWACLVSPNAYGLGIDSAGNIWNSQYDSDQIRKFDPAGNLFAGFPKSTGGSSGDRGVAVTFDGNVWVANSFGSEVSRLDNNGNILKVIPVGSGPMGMAVDAEGKVWAVNFNSNSASRIDPYGGDGLGAVDLTVDIGAGANPYNYSDMTGSIIPAPPGSGNWTIIHDSGIDNAKWGKAAWNASTPGGSSIVVKVSSSNDGVTFGPEETAVSGADLSIADGKYIKAVVSFTRGSADGDGDGIKDGPILYDITFAADVAPTALEVPVDVRPGTCPNPLYLCVNEYLPVAIAGTANFDASKINPSTVRLQGVAPISAGWMFDGATPYSPFIGRTKALDCTKAGADGIRDYALKFQSKSIVAAIGAVNDGDVVVLKMTGNLNDGTPFVGEDVVVINKSKCCR